MNPINDVVLTGIDNRLGVVTEHFAHGGETLMHVHRVDIMTGKLFVCPDNRCRGEHTCPIHGDNVRTARQMSENDMAFYVKEGLLDKELMKSALKARELPAKAPGLTVDWTPKPEAKAFDVYRKKPAKKKRRAKATR